MGAQTPDKQEEISQEIKFEQFHIQVKKIGDNEIGLDIIDTKTFEMYTLEYHRFITQINYSTIIAALNQKQQEYLKLSIQNGQNNEKEPILKVILKVSFDFIPSFEEVIVLPIKKGVSEQDIIQARIKLINSEIQEFNDKLNDDKYTNLKQKKYVSVAESGQYAVENCISITSLTLPKGKYEINVSFYSQSTQNWIYLSLIDSSTNTDALKLQEQGFYYTNINQQSYQPHIIRTLINVSQESSKFTLQTQYCSTYKWNMKNLILSATSV